MAADPRIVLSEGNGTARSVNPGGSKLLFPADAPHPDAALQFINFVLQPVVMAGITNQVR